MKSRIFRKATAIVALIAGLACPASWALWEQVTTVPQWAPLQEHTSLVFDGKMWIFGVGLPGTWCSSDGVHWTSPPQNGKWSGAPVVFNGKLWAYGDEYTSSAERRAWNSADGITWTEVGAAPPWDINVYPFLVFDGNLWAIGGHFGYMTYSNDVWCTSDGVTWTQVTAAAPWHARRAHTVAVHDGKMWLMGGYWNDDENKMYFNDVWSSSDGVTWTAATTAAPWAPRQRHTTVEWGGKLWVIAGADQYSVFSDVWSSADGVNWTQTTSDEPLDAVSGHASVVFEGRLWSIGGNSTTDVWNSSDGARWTRMTQGAPWGERVGHGSVVFNEKIWVLGGYLGWSSALNDVWCSTDGRNWSLSTGSAAWLPRTCRNTALVHNGKLWVLGGESDGATHVFGDIWSSADGADWKLVTGAAPWGLRSGFDAVSFGGKIWVLGGRDQIGRLCNDVWCSADGATWTQVQPSAPWAARWPLGVVGLRDRIWVIAGSDESQEFRDVWSSSDGVVWNLVTALVPWKPRVRAACFVYDDKIWIVGGWHRSQYLNDAWSSKDGATWIEASSAAPWKARSAHACVAFQGMIWLTGGTVDSPISFRDVWTTDDGRAFEFTTLPSGGWKEEGSPLALRVEASVAAGNVTYQWVKDGVKIDGSTNETLTISALAVSDRGFYSCFVTDGNGTEQQTPLAQVEVFAEGSLPVLHPAGLAILAGFFLLAGLRALNRLQTGGGRTLGGGPLVGLIFLAVCATDYASASPGTSPEFYHYVDTIGKVPLVLNKEKIGIRFDGPVSASTQQSVLTTVPGLQPSASLEAVDSRGTMLATLAPGATASSVIATVRSLSKASGVYFASPVVQTNPGFDEMLTNQFYASFPTSVTRDAVEAYNKVQGVETVKVVDLPKRGKTSYQLRLTKAATLDALAMSNLYYEKLGGVGASPDFICLYPVLADGEGPDDPIYADVQQDYQYWLKTINVEGAWNTTKGDPNIVVAVLDSGVDFNYTRHGEQNSALSGHPDLNDNQWVNPYPEQGGQKPRLDFYGWDFVKTNADVQHGEDRFPIRDDPEGRMIHSLADAHGTCCAGIIAASTNNHLGVAGIAGGWGPFGPESPPNGCRVMPLRVVDTPPRDPKDFVYVSDLVDGIYYAAGRRFREFTPQELQEGKKHTPADVLSISLGFWGCSEGLVDAVQYAHDQGCVLVACPSVPR